MSKVFFLKRFMSQDIVVLFVTLFLFLLLLVGNVYNFYNIKHTTRMLRRKIADFDKSIAIEHSILSSTESALFAHMHPMYLNGAVKNDLKLATVKQYYTFDEIFSQK